MEEILSKELLTKTSLSKEIQKSPSYVSNYLRLLTLPEVIKDALLSNMITEGHARALSFLNDREEMIQVFQEIVRYSFSVRRTEDEVNKLRKEKRNYGKVSQELKDCAIRIEKVLGVQTTLVRKTRNITLVLSFPLGITAHRKIKGITMLIEDALKNSQ